MSKMTDNGQILIRKAHLSLRLILSQNHNKGEITSKGHQSLNSNLTFCKKKIEALTHITSRNKSVFNWILLDIFSYMMFIQRVFSNVVLKLMAVFPQTTDIRNRVTKAFKLFK